MNNTGLSNTEAPANDNHAPRLAYEPPQLTAYNQSEITRGGIKSKAGDFVGGGTTSYKS